MELHQVQYFLAICEEGNFTRAAKRCGVKQPSLTRAVQRLETEFKGPLFVRTPKGTTPSQLGRQVRTYFLQIDNGAARAKAIAKLAAMKSAMDVRRQRKNTLSKSFRVSAPWRRRNGNLKARSLPAARVVVLLAAGGQVAWPQNYLCRDHELRNKTKATARRNT